MPNTLRVSFPGVSDMHVKFYATLCKHFILCG